MTPKSLAEFIKDECALLPSDYKAYTEEAFRVCAAELLSVAKEWCAMDAYEQGYDKVTDEHSCDDSRGRNCSADELYDFLNNYINAKEGEKKNE